MVPGRIPVTYSRQRLKDGEACDRNAAGTQRSPAATGLPGVLLDIRRLSPTSSLWNGTIPCVEIICSETILAMEFFQDDKVFRCLRWWEDLAPAGQTCAIPPSTARSTPVMKLLSEQAKKRAVDAISSDRPKRARGTMLAIASRLAFI